MERTTILQLRPSYCKPFSSNHQPYAYVLLCSFLARLLRVSPEVRGRLGTSFQQCCQERVGQPGDALALAMRIICCLEYGVDVGRDALTLREMQAVDGGWNDGWLYKYPSAGLSFANRGLTTALAVKALKVHFAFVDWCTRADWRRR